MYAQRTRFQAGEVVYLRHFQRTALASLYPLRAVRHDDTGILLWGAYGSRSWHLNMPDGRTLRQTALAEWVRAARVPAARTVGHSMLAWHPAGADFSIRFFFSSEGRFTNWYANLELPAVAWRDAYLAGLDTVDWDLDIWIEPDLSWRWKDESEFQERLAVPEHYWVDDEHRVRRAGAQVVALVEAGAFPFDGTWCAFRPDPSWTAIAPPALPAGWDRSRAC